ncbi:hypothetical protein [Neobacillus mesonae]|uniref:hypothetical protein n=1 Tax=Neobacillus mesonae TaxID=1193713 RepID=UPI00203A9FA4|nr:hypothetical protein [Neobacillus mesonae]MCM3568989.1 hypothetical protein [Neobacillus mesonae]
MDSYQELYHEAQYNQFEKEDIDTFVDLQLKLSQFSKYKIGAVIVSFAIVFFFYSFYDFKLDAVSYPPYEHPKEFSYILLSFIIAYFFNHTLAYFLHFWIYKIVEDRPYVYHYGTTKLSSQLFFILLSPDYLYTSWFKNDIKYHHKNCKDRNCENDCLRDNYGRGICLKAWDSIRIRTKFFIELSNWGNLTASTLLVCMAFLFAGINHWSIYILYLLIMIRTLSRAIEILYAFYKDIVRVDDKVFSYHFNSDKSHTVTIYIHDWKNSLLLKSSRVSLAVHSLAEMVLLFSSIYFFLSSFYAGSSIDCFLNENIVTIEHFGFINYLLYSFSVSLFNFSFTSFPSFYWMLAHVIQISLSFVLTIMSIANYLGLNTSMLDRDKNFYIETMRRLQKKGSKS